MRRSIKTSQLRVNALFYMHSQVESGNCRNVTRVFVWAMAPVVYPGSGFLPLKYSSRHLNFQILSHELEVRRHLDLSSPVKAAPRRDPRPAAKIDFIF